MKESKILYAEKDKIYFLKMVGDIRHTISVNFNLFIESIFADTSLKDVFIDLNDAEYIDSTGLGLLAKIGGQMLHTMQRKATMLSSNVDINQVLHSMGFEAVFIIVDNPSCFSGELAEIPKINKHDREKVEVLLETHKTLMEMNEANAAIFRNAVEVLEKEWKNSRER